MSEIENAFARVVVEAEHRALPMAAQLRARSDRRTRRRAVVGTLAVAAVLAAGATVLLPQLGREAPDQVAFPSGTATSSPVTQTSAPPSPPTAGCPSGGFGKTIPAKALVSGTSRDAPDIPLEYRCGEPATGDAEHALPKVCPDGADAGAASILGRRGILAYLKPVQEGYTPNTYFHTVTEYTAPGAATAYLAGLRAAVAACGEYRVGSLRYDYAVTDGPPLGDESLTLTRTIKVDPPAEGMPELAMFQIWVVRVGAYVSVVTDHGWEGSPTSNAEVELDPVLAQAEAKLSAL
ncbi:hypothetical protein [Catellatospora chokoriensis]|uniref:PknH-like extracellular domain-containing protein n=1 Tax=Catellatospora chokoriensis TaxID=310353 RepID=A0A8J3NVM9_9ACTN|nr:hypothetical protein [Catellatospora chokoriensis]GIF92465.1 hypothetical protein Cch02nite_59090 [Catellatospora chokoriensis]